MTNIGLKQSHQNKAYERFTQEGPLALLPMPDNKMSLVWAMSAGKAEALLKMSDSVFLQQLQRAFGYRLGRFTRVGRRVSYPLQQKIMPQQSQWPVIFIGNAAHTLHPVAGQGFNLGLRDAALLAQYIGQYGLTQEMIKYYLSDRRHDQSLICSFTDGLVKLFTNKLPGMGMLRGLGLMAFDNSALLKKILARYAQGYGGVIPDLVCNLPLENRHETTI